MKGKAPSRTGLIAAGFVLAALAVVARAAQLQLLQGPHWSSRAGQQHTATISLPARRGALLDRNGVPLAISQETFAVGVAPRELDDPARAARSLAATTGRPATEIARQLRGSRVWIEWPGPYTWEQVRPLRELRGVHLTRKLERFYPRPQLASQLIGRVDVRGRGGSGLERAFDSLLAGRAGTALMLRDMRGRLIPSPSRPAAQPIDGADVVLTIDAELQDLAERALSQALTEARASGGDVVILQPATGEILAAVSLRRGGGQGAIGVIADTYEPGSTAKIFTAAALLRLGRATPRDTVYAENGQWEIEGRVIHDTHKAGTLTLNDVIRVSSNIGIAKLGARLTPAEQYEMLRDFGFGSPTGVEFAGEGQGRLRPPRNWTALSPASHAMGYEFSVTPLQMASAYASFATEGVLLEPTLVREVRGPDGEARWRHAPRPVRRVVPRQVADQLAHMLRGVVEEGTGNRAALGTYAVAGKTGTARRTVDGRYESGRYHASFVGLFPAVDPQLVLLVKIDDPQGDYFGGSTAAPVTRAILEAALATPSVALDRSRLSRRRAPRETIGRSGDPANGQAAASTVIEWPMRIDTIDPSIARSTDRAVPEVRGLSLREAVRALHRAGFQARIEGSGAVVSTVPAAGATHTAGTAVRVVGERPRAL